MTPDPSAIPIVVWMEGPGIQAELELLRVGMVLIIFLLAIISMVVAYRDR